ncbi:hypothetical protein F4860DRAFT_162606 [Xylaria cubensis]|nr:hypothetical protein F4860DRAFT_162606 [Xylaria cubensis]
MFLLCVLCYSSFLYCVIADIITEISVHRISLSYDAFGVDAPVYPYCNGGVLLCHWTLSMRHNVIGTPVTMHSWRFQNLFDKCITFDYPPSPEVARRARTQRLL